MSTRAADVRLARRRAARRRAVRRRRQAFGLLAFLGAVALGAALLQPLFQTAVRDLSLPLAHEQTIREQAREKRLDPALIAGVIYAESKFSSDTSPAAAA